MKKLLYSNLFFFMLLSVSVFVVYTKSLSFGFVNYDDDTLIVNNISYISDIKNIPKFFTESCFYDKASAFYRPVLTLSFVFEAVFFGTNPKIYHLTNIVLFILSVYLIYVFLSKIELNRNILKTLCLLTAVHPIFTSSVVWIPARNDVLLMIFFCLSIINLINYFNLRKSYYFVFACLFFAVALFTKETALILSLIYFLLIYSFDYSATKKQMVKGIIILLFLFGIYFVLRQKALQTIDYSGYFLNNWQTFVKSAATGIVKYVEQFFSAGDVPVMLHPVEFSLRGLLIVFVVLFAGFILYYKKFIERKIILFGVFWSILALLPTFFTSEYVWFSHRLLVSSAGIIVIMAVFVDKIVKKYFFSVKYLIVFSSVLYFVFSLGSYLGADKYKNADLYWIYSYIESPKYHAASYGLGKQYVYAGNYIKAKELFCESKKMKNLYDYDLAIITTLIAEGNLDEAEKMLLKFSEKKEDLTTFRYLSEIYYVKCEIEKSKIYADKAFKVDPNDPLLLNHLKRLPE